MCVYKYNYCLSYILSSEKPTTKELSIYIKPYAQHWYDIGILLGITVHKLEEIEELHKSDVQSCCVRMLMEWILSDPNTCWKKLWDVVEKVSKNININPSKELGTTCNNVITFVHVYL